MHGGTAAGRTKVNRTVTTGGVRFIGVFYNTLSICIRASAGQKRLEPGGGIAGNLAPGNLGSVSEKRHPFTPVLYSPPAYSSGGIPEILTRESLVHPGNRPHGDS